VVESGPRGEALGAVDELNSLLGVCRAMAGESKDQKLSEIIYLLCLVSCDYSLFVI